MAEVILLSVHEEEVERLKLERNRLQDSLREMIDMVPQNYEFRKNSANRAQVVLDFVGAADKAPTEKDT